MALASIRNQMMKHFYILIFLCVNYLGYSQIELNINLIDQDSVSIYFSNAPEFEMNINYKFIIKSNITDSDSIYLNLNGEFVKDGITFEKTFDYHRYDIVTTNKKDESRTEKTLKIKGIRFKVVIDGQEINRFEPNKIQKKSRVQIELESDLYDITKLTIADPVIFSWMQNQKSFEKRPLVQNRLNIKLSELKKHRKGFTESIKWNHVIIMLPQVYYKGVPVLAKKQQARMQILKFHP